MQNKNWLLIWETALNIYRTTYVSLTYMENW